VTARSHASQSDDRARVVPVRLHLFELEDLPWWPASWRDAGTSYLRWVVQISGHANTLLPSIRHALDRSGELSILDLCSGDGGPIRVVAQELADASAASGGPPVAVLLTDLDPNRQAMAEVEHESGGTIRYHPEPVDATRVPSDLPGLRCLFNSFHHLTPALAIQVLQDTVRNGKSIGVFEIVSREIFPMLGILTAPLLFACSLPFRRPRWSWLFWTFVVPVLPAFILWDGLVSCLRVYTPTELRRLIEQVSGHETYTWEISRVRLGAAPMYATVLVGTPKQVRHAALL